MADQDSFASHWRVKGEDWQMFWREVQGWQSETVSRVFSESKEKIGECSGGRIKVDRARELGSLWLDRVKALCSGGRAKRGNRKRDR